MTANPLALIAFAALALICITVLAALGIDVPDALVAVLLTSSGAAFGAAVPQRRAPAAYDEAG